MERMKSLHAYRPSPAMVIACIALAVALGGTATAAVVLTRNSVLSRHIKNGEVRNPDIRANAVNSAKIADGQVTGFDVAEATLGQVPDAAHAAAAEDAARAANADDAAHAAVADDAAALGGIPADEYARTSDVPPPADTARPWVQAGPMDTKANLDALVQQYPLTHYEWGVRNIGAYESVLRITFSSWNVGLRIMTEPFLQGDGPLTPDGFWLGGSAWFYGTASPSDDACTALGQFRHEYWRWANGRIEWNGGNGCTFGGPFYVRKR